MFELNTKPQLKVTVEKEGKTKETKQAQIFVVPELPRKKENHNEKDVSCS